MSLDFPLPPSTFPATEQRGISAATTKRRRFQVPITRYFNAADPSSSVPEHVLSPPLSDSVQSSLLTVGMRIRKSVPEGYKTTIQKELSFYPTSTTVPHATSYTELAPFCALHKIGGFAVQPFAQAPNVPFSSAHSSIALSAAEQEDPFCFPSSQESTSTVSSMPSTFPRSAAVSNKRPFDDAEENDQDLSDDHSLPFSPLNNNTSGSTSHHRRGSSYPFSHTRMPDFNTLANTTSPTFSVSPPSDLVPTRPIAQPRSRLTHAGASSNRTRPEMSRKSSWAMAGQENQNQMDFDFHGGSNCGGTAEGDFDEARFLSRKEDVEMGM